MDSESRYNLTGLVRLQNRGNRGGNAEVIVRMNGPEPVDATDYDMRVSPTFEVAASPHDLLMKRVFGCTGDKVPEGSFIRYYTVL